MFGRKDAPIPIIKGYVDTEADISDPIDFLDLAPPEELEKMEKEGSSQADELEADGTFESRQIAEFIRAWTRMTVEAFRERWRRANLSA